jgi:hypothetical protein
LTLSDLEVLKALFVKNLTFIGCNAKARLEVVLTIFVTNHLKFTVKNHTNLSDRLSTQILFGFLHKNIKGVENTYEEEEKRRKGLQSRKATIASVGRKYCLTPAVLALS